MSTPSVQVNYLYLHGFCSGANSYKGSWLRRRFAQHGLQLHTPDLNGRDFSRLTLSGQLAEMQQHLQRLQGEVILMGSSMGALLAVLLAQENLQITRLVLIAPAFRFAGRFMERMEKQQLQDWREKGYLEVFHYAYGEMRRLHYDIVEDARKYDAATFPRRLPVLLLHGLKDESVPWKLSADYLESNPEAQLLLLHTDHSMNDRIEQIWQAIQRFLQLHAAS